MANDKSVLGHAVYGELFNAQVPDSVEGFKCYDGEKMSELYPAGSDAAREVSFCCVPPSGDLLMIQYETDIRSLSQDGSARLSSW
jgi:hypothetical protein